MPTVGTAFGRRVPPVDLDEGAPIPPGFVLQLAHELAPSDITDTLRQRVVPDQIFDGQTLDADHLVLADDATRELVLVIQSAVGDTGVDPGHFETSLSHVLTAFLLLCQPSLRLCQFLLISVEEFGVAHAFPRRKHHHRGESQIEPDRLVNVRERLDVLLHQDRDEVAVGLVTGDGHGRRFATLGKRTAPADSQRLLHLGQGKARAIPGEGRGGVFSGLYLVFLLEDGVVRPTLEEVAEGATEMPQRLLKWYAGDLLQPLMLFLLFEESGIGRLVSVSCSCVCILLLRPERGSEPIERKAASHTAPYGSWVSTSHALC
jgi:hypothetical protein